MNKELDPVLAEIDAVLKKHDVMGLVLVSNKTHLDWRIHVEASWSCAKLERDKDGVAVRIRSKSTDFPSREAQKLCNEQTIGTFVTMIDAMRNISKQVEHLLVVVAKHIKFTGMSMDET